MPAVTMVAACINAETGVGPAIASGNQVNRGICADLPVAATNSSKVISNKVASPTAIPAAWGNTVENSNEPKVAKIKNTAIRKPRSPIRFITKAFFAAFTYDEFRNQKPISRYEQS